VAHPEVDGVRIIRPKRRWLRFLARQNEDIPLERPMQPIDIIVKDQEILGGTPVFRGTRVPFQALLDYLEGGQTLDEFLDDFPTVSKEAAVTALELAKSLLVDQLG
jgi:uncharacterized protein (DUF433 family)